MRQLRVTIIILLIISMAWGDILYLANGQVYKGKYEGIVEGEPTFMNASDNIPIIINPQDIIAITDDYGNVIVTKEDLLGQLSNLKRKQKTITLIVAGSTLLVMLAVLLWWNKRKETLTLKLSGDVSILKTTFK